MGSRLPGATQSRVAETNWGLKMYHHLFVYGTLKRGHGNSHRLKHAELLGPAISVNKYKLLANGGIPFMVEDEDANAQVRGELYRVGDVDLARCDNLEGHPNYYQRALRAFKLNEDTLFEAWVYLWPNHHSNDYYHELQPDERGIVEWRRGEDERGKNE